MPALPPFMAACLQRFAGAGSSRQGAGAAPPAADVTAAAAEVQALLVSPPALPGQAQQHGQHSGLQGGRCSQQQIMAALDALVLQDASASSSSTNSGSGAVSLRHQQQPPQQCAVFCVSSLLRQWEAQQQTQPAASQEAGAGAGTASLIAGRFAVCSPAQQQPAQRRPCCRRWCCC
jgi:hypothetical protein